MPGSDDTCGRQAGDLGHSLSEDVDWVADDDNRAASAGESLADIADQDCILAEQVQPGFAGSTASAGGNDDNVSVDHILDGRCPDEGGRVERGSMRQVHGFTFGDSFAHIVEEQFVRYTQVQRGDRHTRPNPTRADDRDSSLHRLATAWLAILRTLSDPTERSRTRGPPQPS